MRHALVAVTAVAITLAPTDHAAGQSYDRYSIVMAEAQLTEAERVMGDAGWPNCWEDWQTCRLAESFLREASWHIMIVFNVMIASRDAQGRACLLTDAGAAYAAALRLAGIGRRMREVGAYYHWGHDAATIGPWVNDPPCPQPAGTAPAWGPSPAPQSAVVPAPSPAAPAGADDTAVAAPIAPGAERCLDDTIPFDASFTGYQSIYGAGPGHLMKGEFVCFSDGYARVTRSDMTHYKCDAQFFECEQVSVVEFTSVEVEAGSTTYRHEPTRSWWVKVLLQ
jgi:hypothetical protein